MNPVRRGVLLVFGIAAVGLLLFNMVWYMLAVNMPPQLQGIVMITAALLIAFSCAKVARGTKPLFPVSTETTQGLSRKMSAILLILFVATILIVPAFVMWLRGAL